MIDLGPDALLFLEPRSGASRKPRIDALTRKMTAAYRAARRGETYRGFHVCRCGAVSTNHDSILPSGLKTNSLCVHYLAHHRGAVPAGELEKVAGLDCGEGDPTDVELRGARLLRAKPWWRFWR